MKSIGLSCGALALATLVACQGETADPDPQARFDELRAAIETERETLGANGIGVAIVEHGEITFAEGFGVKAAEVDEPMLPSTYVRIGSVTKTLTAIGLLKLVDAGLVDLEASVNAYIPELRLDANPGEVGLIRVKDLLTHASGLPGAPVKWADWPDPSDAVLDTYLTGAEFAATYRLRAPPGRMWGYSNLGYDVVGLIIQRVSGRPYVDYMRDEVFEPLGMTRTTFEAEAVLEDGDYALGQTPSGELGPIGSNIPWQRPCGLAFSTISDLARLSKFLMKGDTHVLSAATHASMTSPHLDTHAYLDRSQWGYGVAVDRGFMQLQGFVDTGVTALVHGGDLRGFSTLVTAVPSKDFAVVYVINKHSTGSDAIVSTALTTLAGFQVLAPGTAHEDPSNFGRYVGTYESPDVGKVTVAENAQGITIHHADFECVAEPRSPANFACVGAVGNPLNTQYTFLFDDGGNVEYLRAPFGEWAAARE